MTKFECNCPINVVHYVQCIRHLGINKWLELKYHFVFSPKYSESRQQKHVICYKPNYTHHLNTVKMGFCVKFDSLNLHEYIILYIHLSKERIEKNKHL